jgi:hypothetical protein
MIETKKKFPSPEMLERIACALEIDSPQLFAMPGFHLNAMHNFQEQILADMEKTFASKIQEFENRNFLA